MKELLAIYGIIAAAVCGLALAAGMCYSFAEFWTWQALRWLWGV